MADDEADVTMPYGIHKDAIPGALWDAWQKHRASEEGSITSLPEVIARNPGHNLDRLADQLFIGYTKRFEMYRLTLDNKYARFGGNPDDETHRNAAATLGFTKAREALDLYTYQASCSMIRALGYDEAKHFIGHVIRASIDAYDEVYKCMPSVSNFAFDDRPRVSSIATR